MTYIAKKKKTIIPAYFKLFGNSKILIHECKQVVGQEGEEWQ